MMLVHRRIASIWMACSIVQCAGFLATSGHQKRPSPSCIIFPRATQPQTIRYMASPNFASNDSYQILGITESSTKADIKRAYRKLAMKYHPDVATVDKATASARFGKLNEAYRDALERLERGDAPRSGTSSGTAWEPPHRRSGAYRPRSSTKNTNTSPYASTDWRDYMPNDSETYDTNGDSFDKIFTDLFAQGASSSVSFVSDFLDFFESNFDGYASDRTTNNDPELQSMLRNGSAAEIKSEMEETELVVRQLTTKLGAIREELDPLRQATALRYSERMQNQERIDELEAQQKVVDGYVKTAQQRLLALQNRYKELKQRRSTGTSASSTWNDVRAAAGTSQNTQPPPQSSGANSSSSASTDASWKSEGFGNYGRRSSNRRSRTTAGSAPSPSPSNPQPSYTSSRSTESSPRSEPTSRSSSNSSSSSSTAIPPHRRVSSSYRDKVENERRLREIKVDEEFEKLKKELGL